MDFFINNRKKIFDKIDDNSVAVLFAGSAPKKRGDENYAFSPDRNFYYITGSDKEKQIVLLTKKEGVNATLYIERDNGELAKWVGANMTTQEAFEVSGIEEIKYIDEFNSDFGSFMFKNNIEKVYTDLENRDFDGNLSESLIFADQVKSKYPSAVIKNIYPIFASLREIKEEYELDLMRKAMDITIEAVEEMMKNAKAGMYEYEIEAYFDFVLKKRGVTQKAFETIGASGKNGTVLHYTSNNSKTKEGDLILFDVGAQYGWYNADITRTFPVNGKFTELQKQIYNIVLEGQKKVIDTIKEGIPFRKLNEVLKDHYFEKLKEIGLAEEPQDVNKYYYHGLSHFLGAETHDIGRHNEGVLKSGMVLTVEPGLYIEEYEIGIRIEDDVLVTKDGCDVMTKSMIKTVDEIEKFMSEGK